MSGKRKAGAYGGSIKSHPDIGPGKEFLLVGYNSILMGKKNRQFVTLIRVRDGHQFTMRCDAFCNGKRPPENLLFQYAPIANGDFTLVNEEEDKNLGQGAHKEINLIRTRDGYEFTMRCDEFCSRTCFQCLEMSHCTYADNTCTSCWGIAHPRAALAISPNVGNKTEILVAAMLNAHLGDVRREHPTRENKREDVVLLSTKLAVAIDGGHHFVDKQYSANGAINLSADVQLADTLKCAWWMLDNPDATYVRISQRTAWNGYPVNETIEIKFDFVNAINWINNHPNMFGGKVVFLERRNNGLYDAHRKLLDTSGLRYTTLDIETIDYGTHYISEDKRSILTI